MLASWHAHHFTPGLLPAPPTHTRAGTGKTSLCKALAQKLAIRLGDRCVTPVRLLPLLLQPLPAVPSPARPRRRRQPRSLLLRTSTPGTCSFASAQLIEISAHSLFSKWFSESGKLVARLFAHINEMLEDGAWLRAACWEGTTDALAVSPPALSQSRIRRLHIIPLRRRRLADRAAHRRGGVAHVRAQGGRQRLRAVGRGARRQRGCVWRRARRMRYISFGGGGKRYRSSSHLIAIACVALSPPSPPAVLTAIDALRGKPNVLLLTTSNISGAIDVAFVDRADVKAFVGCVPTTPGSACRQPGGCKALCFSWPPSFTPSPGVCGSLPPSPPLLSRAARPRTKRATRSWAAAWASSCAWGSWRPGCVLAKVDGLGSGVGGRRHR